MHIPFRILYNENTQDFFTIHPKDIWRAKMAKLQCCRIASDDFAEKFISEKLKENDYGVGKPRVSSFIKFLPLDFPKDYHLLKWLDSQNPTAVGRSEALKNGSEVHESMEGLLRGEELKIGEDNPFKESLYEFAEKDLGWFKPKYIEKNIVGKSCVGTLDFLGSYDSPYNGRKNVLLDWKTTSQSLSDKLFFKRKYRFQLFLYLKLLIESDLDFKPSLVGLFFFTKDGYTCRMEHPMSLWLEDEFHSYFKFLMSFVK